MIVLATTALVLAAVLVLREVRSGPPVALADVFDDDGLRSCVARTLGVRIDGEVAERDLEDVDKLECALHPLDGKGQDRSRIKHLDGIERLVGLENVTLAWQPVTDLRPLSTLPRLTYLNLFYVPITDLTGVEDMAALTSLQLGGDGCFSRSGEARLSDISPLAGATNLEDVSLGCTDVSDLTPLAGLTALMSLGLQGTYVSDLEPLAGLPALRTVTLAYTPVEDVSPLAGLTALTWLDLTGSSVTDVSPLAGLAEIEIRR